MVLQPRLLGSNKLQVTTRITEDISICRSKIKYSMCELQVSFQQTNCEQKLGFPQGLLY